MGVKLWAYRIYKKNLRWKSIGNTFFSRINGDSIFLVKIYYFFFNHSFDREMQGVFKGKKLHEYRLQNKLPNISKVRREVHRIEKGLLMPERKPFFAKDYIKSTVDTFINSYPILDDLNKKWAHDVLELYFREIGKGNASIDHSRTLFFDFINSLHPVFKEEKSTPFHFSDLTKANVTIDDLMSLAKNRHSVRFFSDEKIDETIIKKAINVGLESPSACNRQPFEVLYINDPEIINKAVDLPMGISTFKEEVKNLIIIVGDLSYYFDERDRHLIYIDSALFIMPFLFGLESQGVSSCIINWPDIESREQRFHKLFNIPNSKRGICFIAVGYAKKKGMMAFSEKKSAKTILKFNEKFSN